MAGSDIRVLTGLRIKELRDKTGMSQEQFALSIGMARSYFAEIEVGKRNPSLLNLQKIADGLGVPIGELFSAEAVE